MPAALPFRHLDDLGLAAAALVPVSLLFAAAVSLELQPAGRGDARGARTPAGSVAPAAQPAPPPLAMRSSHE